MLTGDRSGTAELSSGGPSLRVTVPAPRSARPSARTRTSSLYRAITAGQAVTDALVPVVALLVLLDDPWSEPALLAVAPVVWLVVLAASGLYRPQHVSAHEEFRRLLTATVLGCIALVVLTPWTDALAGREAVTALLLLTAVGELLTRRSWRWQQWRLRCAGSLAYRTVVVGGGLPASDLVTALGAPDSEYRPVGLVTDRARRLGSDLPVLGDLPDLDAVLAAQQVECVFVAARALDADGLARVADVCRRRAVELRVVADMPHVLTSRLTLQSVGPTVTMALTSASPTRLQQLVKRCVDVVGSGLLLLLLLPALLVVAVAVRLSSPGPVLFRQERVTAGGRSFTMLKFRTMTTDAPRDLVIDLTRAFFKLEDDPRITPVGRVLRRASLDELPQLLNVLRGDMSLVGPRPLPVEQVRANEELLGPRHEVRAGLTGWWQVKGRSGVAGPDAVRLDRFYIDNWSLSLDMYILLKTFGAVVRRTGAV